MSRRQTLCSVSLELYVAASERAVAKDVSLATYVIELVHADLLANGITPPAIGVARRPRKRLGMETVSPSAPTTPCPWCKTLRSWRPRVLVDGVSMHERCAEERRAFMNRKDAPPQPPPLT